MMIEQLLEAQRAMQDGRLDRAERILGQISAADPQNAMALVELARLARRRGDEEAVARLATRALGIDPANDAARRLLDGSDDAEPAGSAPARADAEAAAAPGVGQAAQPGETAEASTDWPWPDLDQQLARYREAGPGWLARLAGRLRRGSREPGG